MNLSSHLADIFNISFSTSIFSSLFKTAKITAIHRKDSKLDYSNYRPTASSQRLAKKYSPFSLMPKKQKRLGVEVAISLLSKIIEKIMYFLITVIKASQQFGFRQKYLTETIMPALDQGEYGCGISVDIEKGFDTVDHVN